MSAFKERPILFSAAMVRAILDGRKTQTRRIVKPKHGGEIFGWAGPSLAFEKVDEDEDSISLKTISSPYGVVGDRLWVRETHLDARNTNEGRILWVADGDRSRFSWTPSIHMPRKLSRVDLVKTEGRVERLQDISTEDAIAEGFACLSKDGGKTYKYGIPDLDGLPGTDNLGWAWQDWSADPIAAYRHLWELINGKGSWDLNPWVWVEIFKAVTP